MKLKAIEKQLIGSSGAEEEVVDEAKLRSKKASELRKHCSPSEEELDDALDSGDAKAALLDLALARQGDEETTAQNHLDALVTPKALRGFHFDMQLQDKDHDGVEDTPEQTLAAIYTVMVGAVGAAFKTERAQHLISQECLGNLELSLQVSHDFLVKGLKESDHPLVEFWHDVKKWLEHGETGIASAAPLMSHHLFDHLLLGTEMIYGVITTFRDLHQVAEKIKLPQMMKVGLKTESC